MQLAPHFFAPFCQTPRVAAATPRAATATGLMFNSRTELTADRDAGEVGEQCWRKRRCAGSASSTGSRPRSAAARPRSGVRSGRRAARRLRDVQLRATRPSQPANIGSNGRRVSRYRGGQRRQACRTVRRKNCWSDCANSRTGVRDCSAASSISLRDGGRGSRDGSPRAASRAADSCAPSRRL